MADDIPLLQMTNVTKVFRGRNRRPVHALDDVNLTLPHTPKIVAVVGQSGSGKSTLARVLLRMEEPTSGTVELEGNSLFGSASRLPTRLLRQKTQAILQSPFDGFSAHLPLDYYLIRTAINLAGAKTRSEAVALAANALAQVGLSYERIAGKFVNQCSGGELQRIAAARALIPNPLLIIADEPVSMIDASLRMNVVNLFLEIKMKRGISFLYITHDISTAYYVADDVVIMKGGRIVEQGPRSVVLENPSNDYTAELLRAVPTIGVRWPELAT